MRIKQSVAQLRTSEQTMLRVAQVAGQLRARASTCTPSLHRLFAGKTKDHSDLDDDVYELLPPGASMKDPLYGLR